SQYIRFFFSSRRRHTRFTRDWSSDVCSSDLVEAILASVAALRADPVLSRWLATRSAAGDGYLTASPVLSRIAASLTRTTDDEAAQWIVRVVLSLLSWPLPDAAAERRLVQRFVAPGYPARP